MKKNLIMLVIVSLIALNVNAQDNKTASSNAEKFSSKEGTLIKKEFEDVGSLKGCKIQIVTYTDMILGVSQSAVRFEYEVASSYSSDTKIAVIDADELEGLLKSIKIMMDSVVNTFPQIYTEVSFKSRGGFEAGCFYSKEKWSTYLKLEKYDSKSYVWLSKDDLVALNSILNKAKLLLK